MYIKTIHRNKQEWSFCVKTRAPFLYEQNSSVIVDRSTIDDRIEGWIYLSDYVSEIRKA